MFSPRTSVYASSYLRNSYVVSRLMLLELFFKNQIAFDLIIIIIFGSIFRVYLSEYMFLILCNACRKERQH